MRSDPGLLRLTTPGGYERGQRRLSSCCSLIAADGSLTITISHAQPDEGQFALIVRA
jgi:hypothetical protein